LENRRGKDDKMSEEMWKAVETEVEKIEMAKTKRRRKKKEKKQKKEDERKKKKKTKKEEDDGSEEGGKRVENLG